VLLGFAIPFAEPLSDRKICFLQAGSADLAEWISEGSAIAILRDGFYFRPRSGAAKSYGTPRNPSHCLVILTLLVAEFSFSKFWKKAVFGIGGLAIRVVKNGARIATLALLANYLDPGFLCGRLQKAGGVLLFLIGLPLLPAGLLVTEAGSRNTRRLVNESFSSLNLRLVLAWSLDLPTPTL